MESLTAGTLAGTGSFRCERCGYVLTLAAQDQLPDCPGCGGRSFARASLFSAGRPWRAEAHAPSSRATPGAAAPADHEAERERILAAARARVEDPGQYVAWVQDGRLALLALGEDPIRIGRSLGADLRFDDPTVSRRHAILVRRDDGAAQILDDRSLNGVFVNGEPAETRLLADGDEIVIGNHELTFLSVTAPVPSPAL